MFRPPDAPRARPGQETGSHDDAHGDGIEARVTDGEPLPPGQDVAELLDRSGERDRFLGRIIQAWRDGYRRGHAEGYQAGYRRGREDQAAELDKAWNRIAQPAARGRPYAELERKRWTVRGDPRTRKTFSQPHPDDYQGREGAA